jgi:rhamnosyltransferase
MISILIRNKNEAKSLEKTIKTINVQEISVPYEIILVDDNSNDNSVEIANKYGRGNIKVIPLDKKFTYGYAINFGVKHCKYDIILLLSSHNLLISNNFFEKLITYFANPKVAGVRCTPIANTKQIEQSFEDFITLDKTNYLHSKDWENLLIANCSAIRKNVALEFLFNEEIRSNEEKLWCLDIMKAGYSIISNVPCYFLYIKKNNSSAEIRDAISKYQVDGIKIKTVSAFLFLLIKSIPWAFRIAFKTWYSNIKVHYYTTFIPFKFKKGEYK